MTHDISYNTFMGAKPLRIRFDKADGVIKIYIGTRYLNYLVLEYTMQFMIGLIIL